MGVGAEGVKDNMNVRDSMCGVWWPTLCSVHLHPCDHRGSSRLQHPQNLGDNFLQPRFIVRVYEAGPHVPNYLGGQEDLVFKSSWQSTISKRVSTPHGFVWSEWSLCSKNVVADQVSPVIQSAAEKPKQQIPKVNGPTLWQQAVLQGQDTSFSRTNESIGKPLPTERLLVLPNSLKAASVVEVQQDIHREVNTKMPFVSKKVRNEKVYINKSRKHWSQRDGRPRDVGSRLCQKLDKVIKVVSRAQLHGVSIQELMQDYKEMLTAGDVSDLLVEFQHRHDWQGAVKLFQWIKRQPWYSVNARQYTQLIGHLGREGKVDMASRFFQEMLLERCKPDKYTFTAMLNAYGKARMIKEAIAVFHHMKESTDCKPNTVTCNALVDALVKADKYDVAIQTFCDMRDSKNGLGCDCKPNVVTYNILIDALCKEGLVKVAMRVLQHMNKSGSDLKILPNSATYNTLINACGKTGLYDKAEELLEHMTEQGLEPDRISYTALIDAYGKAGLWKNAEDTFKGMKSHVQIDVMTYTAMIDAYARDGLHEKATLLFEQMCSTGIQANQVTYLALIEAFGKAGLPDRAENIYISMLAAGYQANVRIYSALIDAYGKVGLYKEAARMFVTMKQARCKPSLVTYSAIISSCSKCLCWEDALVLLSELQQSGTQVELALCTLIFGVEEHWYSAFQILKDVQDTKSAYKSLYNSLMDMLWRFGRKGRAARVLSQSKQKGIYSDKYTKDEWSLDLHGLSVGGAGVALLTWLNELHQAWLWGEDAPTRVRIITGKGKHSKSKTSALKIPVGTLLSKLKAPFVTMYENPGSLAAPGVAVRDWLFTPGIRPQLQCTDLPITEAGVLTKISKVYLEKRSSDIQR